MRGQALLLIAIIVSVAALAIAIVYRVFAMAPAFVYQRSIYYIFKYDPSIVAEGLGYSIQLATVAIARNFSLFMLNNGILEYLHVLQTWTPIPISIANGIVGTILNMTVNSVFEPTGLAIPEAAPSHIVTAYTSLYGALNIPGVRNIYMGGGSAGVYVAINQTFNLPTLGVYNLTLGYALNLTATLLKAGSSTCKASIATSTYAPAYTCTFNFVSGSYTCTGPGVSKAGSTYSIWAWGTAQPYSFYMLLYPVDELDAPGGFRVSAVFSITTGSSIGLGFLNPYPSYPPSGGYGVFLSISSKGSISSITFYMGSSSQSLSCNIKSVGSAINLTVSVTGVSGGPFTQNPTATAYVYINGTLCGSQAINLPYWVPEYSYSQGAYYYVLTGPSNNVGSWVSVYYWRANPVLVTLRLRQSYTLTQGALVGVSINNAPAVGAALSLAYVEPKVGIVALPIQYYVCNITSSYVIFYVNLTNVNPYTISYPYGQPIILINYSGIVTALDPWSPTSLLVYGISQPGYAPSGYSATLMGAYFVQVYNTATGSLTYLTYLWNGGIPTALTIYNGLSIMVSYGSYTPTTVYIVNASVSKYINLYSPVEGFIDIYTFREKVINIPPGYIVINETAPSAYTGLNPNMILYIKYITSQTLPTTYFNQTATDCGGNYAILLTYTPGQGYEYYGNGYGGQSC